MPLNVLGSNRPELVVTPEQRDDLIEQGVLVGDPRRWRPRWFDGRFLAASDLQSEQNYFLVRQADLGRAGGAGVIDGLLVSPFAPQAATSSMNRLRIEPGHGVTDTGELVVLFDALELNPADVPTMQRLDAAFGLRVIPNEPGHTRTGLYVLALRPVEWTANPIGAYPTSLTGTRKVEDSTIVEGVAVSLIPYPEKSTDETRFRRRARVAHEIFVEGRDRGLMSGVLPLAMVSLRGNLVEWVDSFLVRRETGSERPAGMDFGFGDRPLREAHLLQYQRHLADAMEAQNDRPFPATLHFDALPPVGQFPASSIDPVRLTQQFFPAGVDVEVSFIPQDELSAVIEESLLVPAIDLTVGLDGLNGTGVIVLVPLTRAEFVANRQILPRWDVELPRLRPVFQEIRARATPRDLLLSRVFRPVAPPSSPPVQEVPWRELLTTALSRRLLWYVRRRHLPIPSNVPGDAVSANSVTVSAPRGLRILLDEQPVLADALGRLNALGAPEVTSLTRRLSDRRFVDNPGLLRDLVVRAAGPEGTVPSSETAVSVLAAATDENLGEGLTRLTVVSNTLGRTLATERLAESGALPEVDRLARDVPQENLPELASELRTAVRSGENITENVANLRRRFVVTP